MAAAHSIVLGYTTGSGNVIGPVSATSGNAAVFNGTSGQLLSDGGAGGNPFNQNLNTTDTPTFAALSVGGVPIEPHAIRLPNEGYVAFDDGAGNTFAFVQAFVDEVGPNLTIGIGPTGESILLSQTGGKIEFASATFTIRSFMTGAECVFDQGGTLILANLPTSDPLVLGALWNNSGTVKISAGS